MSDSPANNGRPGLTRRVYDKSLEHIQKPYGVWIMFVFAVAESSFFPIPPDVFLMALCFAVPKKSFRYAAICTAGSVLGGAIGYWLGFGFMDVVGNKIIELYGLMDKYETVQALYRKYDVWAVGAAGFTPLPYKLFTITAGAFRLDFFPFMLVSIISRGARFFLVSTLIFRYGTSVRHLIEKYFNILSIVFLILIILGFMAIKWLL